jgi:thiosulfate dehydrogenase
MRVVLLLVLAGCGERGTVTRGGALYDQYWKVNGAPVPTAASHPLWATRPDSTSNTRKGADTWRCKECHGWDYRGVEGVYGRGDHRTGFPGIHATSRTSQELYDLLANHHGYTAAGLTDADLWDLVRFVERGQVNPAYFITLGRYRGDATAGQPHYEAGFGGHRPCAECHGKDGLMKPEMATPGFEEWPGYLADDNPIELLHKMRFGQPGTDMPGLNDLATLEQLSDLGAYAQTLPTRKR